MEIKLNENDIPISCIIFFVSLFGFLCSVISLLILYKKPTLHNAFGCLCVANSFAEAIILFIFTFWSAPIILLNKDLGSTTLGVIIGALLNYLLYYACYIQSIKSFNRVCAILFFTQYRKYFSTESVKKIIAAVAFVCVFHVLIYTFYDCNFYFDTAEYVWIIRNDNCETAFFYVDFGTGMITMLISFICDFTTFFYLLTKKKSTAHNSRISYSREIKFFVQTCLTSVFYGSMLIGWHVVVHQVKGVWGGFISTTLLWTLCHGLNQFCFILFNIRFKKGTTNVQIMSTATNISKANNRILSQIRVQ